MIEELRVLIVGPDDAFNNDLSSYITGRIKMYSNKLHLVFDYADSLENGLSKTAGTHATILNIDLPDAHPDTVIRSIPLFQPPVIILQDDSDEDHIANTEYLEFFKQAEAIFYRDGTRRGISKSVLACLIKSLSTEAFGKKESAT